VTSFVWDKAIFLRQLAHQFKRRPFVPPSLDQHVEDLVALVSKLCALAMRTIKVGEQLWLVTTA
jgi:hypothetical protein